MLEHKKLKSEMVEGKHPKHITREKVDDIHAALYDVDINGDKTLKALPCGCTDELKTIVEGIAK